jgi:peptidoglycan/xylan/chitin deacetylase (PgdA/CDA1 family)
MRRVTLTFDNGPVAVHTDAIVGLLDRYRVPATFFVVGEQIDDPGCRGSLERAKASGHWIANHTFSHGDPLGYAEDAARAAEEIGRAQQAIGTLSRPDRFFRPNGAGKLGPHLLSRAAVDYLAEHHYTVVTWNNVPEDWTEPKQEWVDRAIATMLKQEWSLVVIHDFLIGPMLETLASFIEQARAAGAEFVQDFPPTCVHMRRGVALPSLPTIAMLE